MKLSKYMTEEVFSRTNIYNAYPVSDYKRPFNIDFSLREISQKKENDKVYVNMVYSVEIHDANNNTVKK